MNYKGYTADVRVDDEDGTLYGRVADIRDVVTFVSETREGLEREFRISVDDYLEWCAKLGVQPDQPMAAPRRAASLRVRLSREHELQRLHRLRRGRRDRRREGIEDVVTFEAENLSDLEREFRVSVDDYLALCARQGVQPDRPRVAQRRTS